MYKFKYAVWYDPITHQNIITDAETIKEVVMSFEKNIEKVSYKEFVNTLKNKGVKEQK